MITAQAHLITLLAEIDAMNAADPRHDSVAGLPRPREILYAERMSACLERLYPHAAAPLLTLTDAYRAARYSDHPATADDAERAESAFQAIVSDQPCTEDSPVTARAGG